MRIGWKIAGRGLAARMLRWCAPGPADGVGVDSKITDGVDESVAVLPHMGQVRGLPIPGLQILQHPQIVLALDFRQVLTHRKKLLHKLGDLGCLTATSSPGTRLPPIWW